jgi:hypothetical protein
VGTTGRAERRQAELRHAQNGLRAELKHWQHEATQPEMEKHQTQIDSLARMFGRDLDVLDTAALPGWHERILDLYHVWDFFRAKLVLRYVEPLRTFLEAADELAWTTYRPAVEAAGLSGQARREPPLVFLDRGAVPFASTRGSSYRNLLPRDVRTRAGADAASKLPFPVIGLPWYLTSHLPAVLLVVHEVGHHIEDDCGLGTALSDRLAAAPLPVPRQEVWRPWLGETFADVVASVSCGVAYPTVLSDALAAAPADGAGAERYPPPRVRVRICLAALSCAGLPEDPELATAGDGLGDPTKADDEAAQVVAAILADTYRELGGRSLPAVLHGSAVDDAGVGAGRFLAGVPSGLTDVRAVFAAAALAFARNPQEYDDLRVGQRAIKEVLDRRPKGPRLVMGQADRKKRDVAAGDWLLDVLNA